MPPDRGAGEAREKRVRSLAWLLALAGGTILAILPMLAPLLRDRAPRLSALLYAVFAPLCHQLPDRCLHVAGHPFAVCGRCSGVYFGFVLGTLAFPWLEKRMRPAPPPPPVILLVALIPLVLDAGGRLLGAWDSPIGLRLATGALWGSVLPAYLIPGLREVLARFPARRPPGRRASA